MAGVREAVAAMRAATEQLQKAVAEAEAMADRNRSASEEMSELNNKLVSHLDSVSAVVEENTAATEEMAAGSTEVSQSIENIASVSEENSAAVEQVSASAEEMSAQVEEVTASAQSLAEMAKSLQEIVAQFKLGEGGTKVEEEAQPKAQPTIHRQTISPITKIISGNGHRYEELPTVK